MKINGRAMTDRELHRARPLWITELKAAVVKQDWWTVMARAQDLKELDRQLRNETYARDAE